MKALFISTKKLLVHLKNLHVIYENEQEPSKDEQFFYYVQTETNAIFQDVEAWEKLAVQAVFNHKITLHPAQIDATKDNITALILNSYYKDVRKKRYMEIHKSCKYIFEQILKETHDEEPIDPIS